MKEVNIMRIKQSETRIHPDYTKRVSVSYSIEYTEKDEAINSELSNLKKVICLDLETMLKNMFDLRQLNKFNINLYTITYIDDQWITEDSANDCERFIDTKQGEQLIKSNRVMHQSMEAMAEELNEYKEFVKLYKSEKLFEDYQKGLMKECAK